MPAGRRQPAQQLLPDWDDIDDYVQVDPLAPGPDQPGRRTMWPRASKLFEANGCAGCHGGSHWTLASVFYTPNEENNGAQGLLRTTRYTRAGPASPRRSTRPRPRPGTGKAPLRFSASTDPAVSPATIRSTACCATWAPSPAPAPPAWPRRACW